MCARSTDNEIMNEYNKVLIGIPMLYTYILLAMALFSITKHFVATIWWRGHQIFVSHTFVYIILVARWPVEQGHPQFHIQLHPPFLLPSPSGVNGEPCLWQRFSVGLATSSILPPLWRTPSWWVHPRARASSSIYSISPPFCKESDAR
jgi:hypothetical protein